MSQQPIPEFADVEALLRVSATEFSYPRTPDIAAGVLGRLDEEPSSLGSVVGATVRRRVWQLAAAVVAAAAIVAAAALLTPQSRGALADFFGLSRVSVEVGPALGPPPPALSPESFAEPATLAEAQEQVDFAIRLPAPDGTRLVPDAVYVEPLGLTSNVVIAVHDAEGYDLYQSAFNFFGKGIPDESLLAETTVNGAEALWIATGGHIARSLDEEGRVLIETERSVERATLFWEEAGVTYRLETDLSLDEAITVAESLR